MLEETASSKKLRSSCMNSLLREIKDVSFDGSMSRLECLLLAGLIVVDCSKTRETWLKVDDEASCDG